MEVPTADEKQLQQYTRQRIEALLHGGAFVLYQLAGEADDDPGDLIAEKVDLERALGEVGLPEKVRAAFALVAMGWSLSGAARAMSCHDPVCSCTDHRVHAEGLRRILDGSATQPGLVTRLEAILNGEEVP